MIDKLELKAKHFKRTEFWCNKCAIGKAFHEKFGEYPSVGVDNLVKKDGNTLVFDSYGEHDFETDRKIARKNKYNDTVIRTIEFVVDC